MKGLVSIFTLGVESKGERRKCCRRHTQDTHTPLRTEVKIMTVIAGKCGCPAFPENLKKTSREIVGISRVRSTHSLFVCLHDWNSKELERKIEAPQCHFFSTIYHYPLHGFGFPRCFDPTHRITVPGGHFLFTAHLTLAPFATPSDCVLFHESAMIHVEKWE